jgi:tight adherence protein C
MDYHTYIPFFVAGLIAFLFYLFLRDFDFSFGHGAASRVEQFAVADRRGLADRLGDSIVERTGLSLDAWRHELHWAHLGGFYTGKTVGSVVGRAVLFAGVGILYLVMFRNFSPVLLAGVGLAAYYPYMQLRGRANDTREMVKRSLPEAAALIAAEMSAGSSAETAITRAANLPGPFGTMVGQAVQIAQQSGRLIFSRDSIQGVLVEHFSGYRMSHLEAFAQQIDLVASKGAEGPQQMGEVARGLSREYRSDVAKAAENLSNKLLAPMSLYFFVPFLLAIFIPLLFSVFQSF